MARTQQERTMDSGTKERQHSGSKQINDSVQSFHNAAYAIQIHRFRFYCHYDYNNICPCLAYFSRLSIPCVFFFFIEVRTSLGALSKHFVGIELDCPVTFGSVMIIRVKSSGVTAMCIGDRYMR